MDLEPKGLINKLGRLSSAVVAADARPTVQMYTVFEDLSSRIEVQLNVWTRSSRKRGWSHETVSGGTRASVSFLHQGARRSRTQHPQGTPSF